MSGTTTPPAPAPAPAPAAPPAAPWYQGKVDDVTVGMWQSNGWDPKDPATVAIAASKAFADANKFNGAPADRLLKLPAEAGDPEWDGVYQRLGKPKDMAEYDFKAVKFADGAELDPAAEAFLRDAAFKANISKEAAAGFAAGLVKFLEGAEAGEATERAAALQTQQAELARSWGVNMEANKFLARQGALALGLTEAEVAGLENSAGYAKTMEALRRVGVMNGEAKYISGSGQTQGGVMTREQAMARRAELKSDPQWNQRFLGGDKTAQREMLALNTLIVGAS